MSELNKPAMPKIDAFHYHEIADRCGVIQYTIEDHIFNHPAMIVEQRIKVENAQSLIGEVYQWAAQQADALLAACETTTNDLLISEQISSSAGETQPDAEGWIEWKGGECPVPFGASIEVAFSGGVKTKGRAFNWTHDGGSFDIIAYRIVKEAKE
jgi:hypothetical protein